ncbi:MAG: hypothetical protein ACT4QD_10950 [Acidobacteriota bacterium]
MSDQTPLELLEQQITALTDTHKGVAGLIEKLVRIQAALATGDFQAFSDRLGEPFVALSTVAEAVQGVVHDIEIERNRICNEQ